MIPIQGVNLCWAETVGSDLNSGQKKTVEMEISGGGMGALSAEGQLSPLSTTQLHPPTTFSMVLTYQPLQEHSSRRVGEHLIQCQAF
mmetsp:Transcript_368/g.1090  ORF Transcript_368/g.1090 Transcript_368/m.1090 type:complete len:87 (-) Transcript_368:1500-1760(-)